MRRPSPFAESLNVANPEAGKYIQAFLDDLLQIFLPVSNFSGLLEIDVFIWLRIRNLVLKDRF